ncbi:MAG: NAD(P)H-binding protein [Planctomycetota bacterium]
MPASHHVFMTGATGYVGRRLIGALTARGHRVTALVRPGGEHRLVGGAVAVAGDPLRAESYVESARGADALVQLVGARHPAPWKKAAFRRVDLAAGLAAVAAVRRAAIAHLVYVSVAQPAPVMKAYASVRAEVEAAIAAQAIDASIMRPWYVLGPGHRWPLLLLPWYKLLERVPATRAGALRLGLVTIAEMLAALGWAVEHPARGQRVIDVPGIRELARELGAAVPVC